MTRNERKRAALLEEVSQTYCQTGTNKNLIVVAATAMTVFCALMSPVMIKKNEPDILMPMNILISSCVLTMLTSLSTSLVGDISNPDRNNAAVLKTGGTMMTGKFLCTLPFEGKDILNLRFINWERQLILKTAFTVIIQIILLALGFAGYEISGFVCGAAILLMFIGEIFLLASFMTKSGLLSVAAGVGLSAFSFLGEIALMGISAERSIEAGAGFVSFVSAFSGISGIVLTIALTAAFILVGEKLLSGRKLMSWKIK